MVTLLSGAVAVAVLLLPVGFTVTSEPVEAAPESEVVMVMVPALPVSVPVDTSGSERTGSEMGTTLPLDVSKGREMMASLPLRRYSC